MKGNMLYLGQNLPFPPHGGASIRSYHMIRMLAKEFNLTAMCFDRPSESRDSVSREEAETEMSAFGNIASDTVVGEGLLESVIRVHLPSMFTQRPYTDFVYRSRNLRRTLEDNISRKDVVGCHIDSVDLGHWVPCLKGLPFVLAHHNVESELLWKRADLVGGTKGAYMKRQAKLVRRRERDLAERALFNTTVSDQDAATLRDLAPRAKVRVVPNGVDTSFFSPGPKRSRDGLVFVGGATWFPNRDAMQYFMNAILPRIRARNPDIGVTWVGRIGRELKDEMVAHDVKAVGYVEDVRPYMEDAACYVVPLRVGGGTRLKILDAWAMGKAVVSTTVGAEGLAYQDGENILIGDDPESFAVAVQNVMMNPSLREMLERNARKVAVARYSWNGIGEEMLDFYRAAMGD